MDRMIPTPLENVGPIEKLSTLANEFKHNIDFRKKVDYLSNEGYHSWRRIRGDGNCFYRAAGFGLFEWFASQGSRSSRATVAGALSEKLREVQFSLACEQTRHEQLLQHLEEVMNGTNADGESALMSLSAAFADPDGWMDMALIQALRRAAARFLMLNVSNKDIGNGLTFGECIAAEGYADMDAFCQQKVLPDGIEAEGIIQNTLAFVLGIKLRIIFLDRAALAGSKVPFVDIEGGQGPEIFMQLRPGHYDLIYRSALFMAASSSSAGAPVKVLDRQKNAWISLKDPRESQSTLTPQRQTISQASAPTPEKNHKIVLAAREVSSPDSPTIRTYRQGTAVEYFRQESGDWVSAVVQDYDENAGIYVLDIEKHADPKNVRAVKALGSSLKESPLRAHRMPPTAMPGTLIPAGTSVEYYSESAGSWIPAKVQGFNDSTKTYVLDVQPVALQSKVRVPSFDGVSGYSSTHTQLHPTGAEVEYYSQSAGNWISACVLGFNSDTGIYVLDRQPAAYPSKVRARRQGQSLELPSPSAVDALSQASSKDNVKWCSAPAAGM